MQQYLVISTFIATQLITGCSDMADEAEPDSPEVQANPMVAARFYETLEQCEADAKKQEADYATKLKAYHDKQLKSPAPAGQATKQPQKPPLLAIDGAIHQGGRSFTAAGFA
jgi:hypothetical protein